MGSVGFHSLLGRLRPRVGDESGATMVEYSLMVVLIAVAALVAVQVFGLNVLALFQPAADAF